MFPKEVNVVKQKCELLEFAASVAVLCVSVKC